MNGETVFVVGLTQKFTDAGAIWDLLGIFGSEAEALNCCRTPQHFIGEVEFGKDLGDAMIEWPSIYYPRSEKKP